MKAKGIDFPAYQPGPQSPNENESKAELSPVKPFPEEHRKLIEQMNLVKGNTNFANELIDNTPNLAALQQNDTLKELIKTLKEMESHLHA